MVEPAAHYITRYLFSGHLKWQVFCALLIAPILVPRHGIENSGPRLDADAAETPTQLFLALPVSGV